MTSEIVLACLLSLYIGYAIGYVHRSAEAAE